MREGTFTMCLICCSTSAWRAVAKLSLCVCAVWYLQPLERLCDRLDRNMSAMMRDHNDIDDCEYLSGAHTQKHADTHTHTHTHTHRNTHTHTRLTKCPSPFGAV